MTIMVRVRAQNACRTWAVHGLIRFTGKNNLMPIGSTKAASKIIPAEQSPTYWAQLLLLKIAKKWRLQRVTMSLVSNSTLNGGLHYSPSMIEWEMPLTVALWVHHGLTKYM